MKRDLTLPQLPKTDSSGNINQQELVQFLSAIQRILDEKQREDYNESMNKMPVNSTYIQFPHMEDGVYEGFREEDEPAELFGGVWFQMFEEEGSFFKTEGYEPEEIYENKSLISSRDPLTEISKDRTQLTLGMARFSHTGLNSSNGAMDHEQSITTSLAAVGSAVTVLRHLYFNSSWSNNSRTTTNTAGRTEPQNRLIRIWKRES